MSLPTPGDVHVNRPLTNLSVAYIQAAADYAADRAAPVLGGENQSDVFFKFDKDYWFRDSLKVRGPGAQAEEAGYGVSTDSYFAPVWSIRKKIDDQVRKNTDSPLDTDRNAMQFLSQLAMIRREKAFAAVALTTGVWGSDVAGVSGSPGAGEVKQWNDAASTPLEDVAAERSIQKKRTGLFPNVLVLGQEVWDKLKVHPDILALVNGGATTINPALVTRQMVAQAMELEEIVVSGAVENTAAEGATFSGSFIAGKKGLLLHRNTAKTVEAVTAIRTFTWKGYAGNDLGVRVLKYREEPHFDVVEVESAFAHKIVASDAGTYFATLVA